MALKPNSKGVITGTDGNDSITWESSSAWKKALTVNAGAGNDVINFKKSKYNNTIKGNDGKDKIYGGSGNDTIYGGAGNDTLNALVGGNNFIYGESGNDLIAGGNGDDYINGGAGNDTIYGTGGTNILKGGAGNDTIYAGTGNDTIYAGAGNDTIDLSKGGNNIVYCESGTNNVIGGAGKDKIFGGTDDDTIYGGKGNDTISLANGGNNFAYGEAGNDAISGGAGNDYINGGAGNDTIKGINGANTLKGGAGNDTIYGGKSSDKIYGGAGDDVINGGKGTNKIYFGSNEGNDSVYYGGGADVLIFTAPETFNEIALSYSGSSLIIDSDYGNSVAVKKYIGNLDHSAKYIQIGNVSKKIETLLPVLKVTNTNLDHATLTTTNGKDKIKVTGGSYGVINAGAGNDSITIDAKRMTVNAGKGNDVINLLGGNSYSTYVYNAGDGNDYIYGVDNIGARTTFIEGDGLIHNFRDYEYVLGEQVGNDLVLKSVTGENVTVKDFYSLTNFYRGYAFKVTTATGKNGYLYDDFLRMSAPEVTYITNQTSYTLDTSHHLYILSGNTSTTVNNSCRGDYLWLEGNKAHTVNLSNYAEDNHIFFNNTLANNQHNTVDIAGKYNEVMLNSKTQMTVSGTGNIINANADVSIISSGDYASTYNLNGTFNSSLNTKGAEQIYLNGKGYATITYASIATTGKVKNIFCNSDDYRQTIVDTNGYLNKYKTNIGFRYADNINMVFKHDWHTGASAVDNIRFYSQNPNDSDVYDQNELILRGKWNEGVLNIDSDEASDNLKIRMGSAQGQVSLSGVTQLVDTSSTYINHDFNFSDPDGMGILQHRKDVLVNSLSKIDDIYEDYELELTPGGYTIIDRGGNDSLQICLGNSVTDLFTYFDINLDGTYGKDLYFTDATGLSSIISGDTPGNYLKIKDGFEKGKMETVTAEEYSRYQLNYSNLLSKNAGSLIADVVGWLTDRGFSSTSEAIASGLDDDGQYTLCAAYNRWDDWSGFNEWQLI